MRLLLRGKITVLSCKSSTTHLNLSDRSKWKKSSRRLIEFYKAGLWLNYAKRMKLTTNPSVQSYLESQTNHSPMEESGRQFGLSITQKRLSLVAIMSGSQCGGGNQLANPDIFAGTLTSLALSLRETHRLHSIRFILNQLTPS